MKLWRRKSKLFMVYVRLDDMKFPIVIPLPLIVVEELLRGLGIVAWLGQSGISWWSKRHHKGSVSWGKWEGLSGSASWKELASSGEFGDWASAMLGRVKPWRVLFGLQKGLSDMRQLGPFDFVNVDTDGVRVRISMK